MIFSLKILKNYIVGCDVWDGDTVAIRFVYFTVTFLYVLKFNHFSKNLFSSSLVAYSLRKFTTFSLESALISKPRPLMTGYRRIHNSLFR